MKCEICLAPALGLGGACVFCHSPLPGPLEETEGLLDYLAPRLPAAAARRGLFGRGPVRGLKLDASGERFRARLRKEGLVLEPELAPPEWVDRLLSALSRSAAADGEVRDAVSRAGWALRP